MTAPRHILPGRTWFITRRTTRRHFLLRPDADGAMQKIYWYITAVIAKKFGIRLHAVQILSTHMHEVLTDVEGKLPAFLRERNRLFANVMKTHRRWPEEFFQRAPTSCIQLYGPEAVITQIAYTLVNCVEAGLVRDPSEWPGVTVVVDDIGKRVVTAPRPKGWFNPKKWPDEASIEIEMPTMLTSTFGSVDAATSALRNIVEFAVDKARASVRKAGRSFATAAKVVREPFTKRANSPEPRGRRNPSFATGGNEERLREAKAERASFRERYDEALEKLRRGTRKVRFPEGTWRWCVELLPQRHRPLAA